MKENKRHVHIFINQKQSTIIDETKVKHNKGMNCTNQCLSLSDIPMLIDQYERTKNEMLSRVFSPYFLLLELMLIIFHLQVLSLLLFLLKQLLLVLVVLYL